MQNNAVTDSSYKNGQRDNLQKKYLAQTVYQRTYNISVVDLEQLAVAISIIVRRLHFIVALCICTATSYI